ncbi:wax ester/triacylglycerol synthase domain-containing protein [Streptomyces sp. M10(2022)]
MTTELLAPLDLAFWHLESDAHPMHLGALAVFSPASGVAQQDILELLGARAAAIPRLRMRVRDVLLPVGERPGPWTRTSTYTGTSGGSSLPTATSWRRRRGWRAS